MQRFLVFPIVFGICGTLLLPVSLWQGVVGTSSVALRNVAVAGSDFWTSIFSLNYRADFGFAQQCFGLFVGLAFAIWDLMRNKRDESAAVRLHKNLFYCGFYALCLSVANASLGLLIFSALPTGSPLISLFVWLQFSGAVIFNLTAIFWAAIRSITTDDVLTPRVLRDKLRGQAHL